MDAPITETTDYGAVVHIPRQLRNYAYIRTIGTGGSSVVIELEDLRTRNIYAGKFVPRSVLDDPRRLQLFERELRLLQSLNHENICHIEEIIYLPESIVIVMERCENGDLFTYLTTHSFILPVIKRRMFYEICRAVAYLHSRNVAHRDIKPENIFIDEEMHVRLGDFGLVREAEDGQILNTVCGTLCYSAPELILQGHYDGKKVDVWGLGIVLFCMEVGEMPWTTTNASELREQITSGELDIPTYVPRVVADVIRACMRKDPNERPTVNEILEMDWLKSEAAKYQRGTIPSMTPILPVAAGRPSIPVLRLPAKLMLVNKSVGQVNGIGAVESTRRVLARPKRRMARKSDLY